MNIWSKTVYSFFHFRHLKHDRHALKNLETIDDDLDLEGVILVRLADENSNVADHYSLGNGIIFLMKLIIHYNTEFVVHCTMIVPTLFLDMVPCLILFHEGRPYIYKGEISDENEAIKWFRKKLVSFDEL